MPTAVLIIVASLFSACAVMLFCSTWLTAQNRARLQKGNLKRLGVMDHKSPSGNTSKLLALSPFGAMLKKREKKALIASFERDLPACLEVIALGMQAGMGFDQAFALYTERFDTALARHCHKSLNVWQKGLKSRDEGMRELADRIDTPAFRHFSSSVLRALRFGSPMAPLLMNLAQEARKEYRAKRQELVAKAPVKMLLPTGVLILPAMLLLVMGPIVLDLMGKMG